MLILCDSKCTVACSHGNSVQPKLRQMRKQIFIKILQMADERYSEEEELAFDKWNKNLLCE